MKSKIVAIVGPTAADKTKTAIGLAKEIDGEIISCDSMQVYRHMPILTQSPSRDELKEIPHHLVARISPEEEYSAARFSKMASVAIREIFARGKTPIITGGTGLYLKALIDGLFPSPEKDIALRRELESKSAGFLYKELTRIDPESAKKIHPNDIKKLVRVLEVYYLTGIPVAEHNRMTKGIGDKYKIILTGLSMPRETLYKKINRRVDNMFRDGLVEEVRGIVKYRLSISAGCAIGIKEIVGYLDKKYDLDKTKEMLKRNTRRYAKRQLTWFGADKRIIWFGDGKSLISYCRSKV